MDQAIVTGLFALSGVLIGGTVNSGTAYWMQRRQERHHLRTVVRLLIPELSSARASLRTNMQSAIPTWGVLGFEVERWPSTRTSWPQP